MEGYVNLQNLAYRHLKKMILDNQLENNVIYSETKVAKSIGISRTPMRDAVRILAKEGFVDRIPSKGFTLHEMSLKDVLETFQIRCALEGFCSMQIANDCFSERSLKTICNLEGILRNQEQILNGSKSIAKFAKYDNSFHHQIVLHCKNQTMIEIYNIFIYKISRQIQIALAYEDRMEKAYLEHKRILEKIKAGDTANIYKLSIDHMEIATQIIPLVKSEIK